MAKRKRLIAPDPSQVAAPAPETKSMDIPTGYAPDHMKRRAPIADVAGQAAATSALQQIASEMSSARAEGRLVQKLPLSAISAAHLVRDRLVVDADDMASLEASLAARGQQTPIEVVQTGQNEYGLISGWRRLTALRNLQAQGGTDTVLALIRKPQEASDAYTAMVEENEIRVGLTYFERAHIVLRAVAEGVFRSEKEALNNLFASASRAKRSKIKSFIPVVHELGARIRFPGALTERLGLALAAHLAAEPDSAARIYDRLRKADAQTAEEETALLQKVLGGAGAQAKPTPGAAVSESKQAAAALAQGVTLSRTKAGLQIKGPGLTEERIAQIEALVREWSK